jgi:pimeloyl-ACP methyl ester carboxylesterase
MKAPAETTRQDQVITIDGLMLETYRVSPQGRPNERHQGLSKPPPLQPLVMLHEGLGCAALWRDLPTRLAAATGRTVVAYSRYGYGQSTPFKKALTPAYMHEEALQILPKLLDHLEFSAPILLGHSDGASIALIHAADNRQISGLILEAPHVFVEDMSVQAIAAIRDVFTATDLPQKLGRYHRDPARTFYGWNDIWLHPDFRAWDITGPLAQIHCPTLVIQGLDDEYGSVAQVDAIAAAVSGSFQHLILPDCGHSPHRDQKDHTDNAIVAFLKTLP